MDSVPIAKAVLIRKLWASIYQCNYEYHNILTDVIKETQCFLNKTQGTNFSMLSLFLLFFITFGVLLLCEG